MKRSLLLLLLFPSIALAQGGRLTQDPWVSNRQGFPAGGTNIAICQPLATTAASVTSNLVVFTMASNPITAGFAAGMTIQVAGFTGGDTFFNAGTLANGFLTGGLSILSVSTTTVIASLNHANASAVTNGTLLQFGNTVTPCAGLATIYTDASITTTTPNPFQADGLGNYGAGAAAGVYYTQLYGSGITTTLRQIVVASPTGGGGGGGSICITTANSIQYNNAGVAGCATGITTPDGNIINIKGPIPWIDATQYGMRTFGNPPNTITVTTAASSPTIPTTGISDFINNDGVVIPKAGNATAQSTPAAPTLAMIGASGAQTVNYKCVGVDRQWGLTIASAATAITNVPTVFGAVATQISTISRSANVVTVTTTIPMPFSSGTYHARIANITGGTTQFSGLQAVTVTGATTLTYSQTGADESGTAGSTSFVRFDNAFFVTTAQATAGSNQVVLTTDIAHNIQWNNSAFNPDEVFVDGIQFTGANPQGYSIGPFPVGGVGGSTITINTSYTSPITVTGVANHIYSTSQSGVDIMTVTNFPKVIVSCPALAGTTVYYAVYADYGTGYAPIGFTPWLHNKLEDYGPAFTKTGFTPPPAMNLPATPPVAAQNQVFAGQIASIAGSTLTLTGNVPAMVSGVTAYHDDGVPFQNAIAASCNASGGNTFNSVYLPPGIAFGYYFFHAPVDLSVSCARVHIVDGGAIFANGTIYDDNSVMLEWSRPQDLSGWNVISTGAVNKGQIYVFGLASPEMVTPPIGSSYIAGLDFNITSNGQVGLFVQNNNARLVDNTYQTNGANNLSAIPFEGSNIGFEFRMTNTAWGGGVNTQYPVTAAGDPPVGDIAYWPVPVFDFFGPASIANSIIIDGVNYGNLRGFRFNNLYGNTQNAPMVIISDVQTYQSPYNPLWKAVGNDVMPRLSITRAISDSIQQTISSCIRSDNGTCANFYNDDVVSSDGSANFPVLTGPPYGTALQYVSPGAALAQNTNEWQVGGGTSGFNLYGAGTGTNPILSLFCSGGTGNAFSSFDTTATSRTGITCPGGLLSIGGTTGFTGTATQANTANRTYTFPNITGTIPLFTITPTNGDCVTWSGTAGLLGDLPGCGGGAGMNTNMNNMANPTAMSQSLIPGAVNTVAVGSQALPVTNICMGTVANQAGCFNTANLTANRTMNIPDATSTLVRDCPVTTNQFMQAEAIATGTCTKSLINATASSVPSYIADTGAADVYVATLVPAIVAYAPGLTVRFLPANPNATTTPTLNVNGLGAITITKFGQAALQANDLITTAVAQVVYDGTDFELLDPATFSTALTSSSTNTLTNKTINCESTGNNCSEPIRFYASAAGCSGGSTAGPSLDTGTTNAPTPQCGGTTVTKAYLQFIRGNVAYANGHLPPDWNSSASTDIELGLISTDTTNGHVISFNVQTGCNAASTGAVTDDPTLNALQAASVTIGGAQVSGGALNFKLTGLTMTGCAADSDFEIAITRNNSGTDTATNALTAVQLKFAEVTFGVTKNAANR